MGDQADGMEYFSATDTAFQAAQLPEPPLDDQHQPLGSDVWGRYVCHMLRLSGIEVKLAASSANPNEATWNAAQITNEASLRAAFQVKELSEIKMVTADQFLGLHVKLSGACQWQLSWQDEIPDRKNSATQQRSRRAATVRGSAKSFDNRATYELALVCSSDDDELGLRTTMAVGDIVSIAIVFARNSSGGVLWLWLSICR